MSVKYDGIIFANASEVSSYKAMVGIVCGGGVDSKLEDEINEINRLENDGINDDFDNSPLSLMEQLEPRNSYTNDNDYSFGELIF
jgi:hexokinase